MDARAQVAGVLALSGGVFAGAEHPELRRTAERMARQGDLRRLFPGVYCQPESASVPEVRFRAAAVWAPQGVLTGAAAARLTFWPTLGATTLTMSLLTPRPAPAWVRLSRERIPPELVTEIGGCRITVPALTALDLAEQTGGESVDRVLRQRQASLDTLADALNSTPGRLGNDVRRRWLLDSRDEPWSPGERESHRLLRAARITDWQANLPVVCGEQLYYLDCGFRRLKLGIEIDGREVHGAENAAQFLHDRRKWTTLTLFGWTLLHFGATHISDEPDWFLDCVRQAEARLRRRAA